MQCNQETTVLHCTPFAVRSTQLQFISVVRMKPKLNCFIWEKRHEKTPTEIKQDDERCLCKHYKSKHE